MIDLITKDEVRQLQPSAEAEPIPTFKGFGEQFYKGPAFGFAATMDILGAPAQKFLQDVGYASEAESLDEWRGNLRQSIQDYRPNPYRTGAAGNIVHGLGSIFTAGLTGAGVGAVTGGAAGTYVGGGVAGPLGAYAIGKAGAISGAAVGGVAAMGAVAGYSTYLDPQLQEVDEDTRARLAGLSAMTMAIGGGAPAYFGGTLLKQIGTGVAMNVGLGAFERNRSSAVLENAGYDKLASHYKTLDAEAILIDAILGAAFPIGHRMLSDLPSTRSVDSALELESRQADQRRDPILPATSQDLDAATQARIDATMQIFEEGRPLSELEVRMPETVVPNPEFTAAMREGDALITDYLISDDVFELYMRGWNTDFDVGAVRAEIEETVRIQQEIQDAIQKRGTTEVDVREQARDGEAVAERNAKEQAVAAARQAEAQVTPESFSRAEAQAAAERFADVVVKDSNGNLVTAKELIDQAERLATTDRENAGLFNLAITCALNNGVN